MAKNVKPGKLRGNTNLNAITSNPNDYILTIIGGMSYSLNDLAQLVVKSGITTLREEQLVDSFRLMAEKGVEMALQGNNVNFDYFTLRFGVKGVFDWANEPFNRSKHKVTASMSVGADVRKAMEDTLVENMGPARHYAQIDTIINTVSGEVNRTLTAGEVLDIKGANLSVLGENPQVGLYLQEENSSADARIKVSTILTNEPEHLMFMVPANLEKGKKYFIVSISQAGASRSENGMLHKDPRTELSPCILTCTDGHIPEKNQDEDRGIIP